MIYKATVCTTTRARLLRRGAIGALALAAWIGPARARAAELGDNVSIPKIDPAKGAGETFDLNTFAIIREGNTDWRIVRGKYRESVSRDAFFAAVGRPDLGSRDSSRQAKHNLLVLGGVVGILGGVFITGASFSKGGWDPPWALGGGLMAGGLIAYFASDLYEGPDLKADEAEGLALRYNDRLHDSLQEQERDHHIQAMPTLRLAPWIAQGTGGLGVAARF